MYSSVHIHGLSGVVHMYVCGVCETQSWLTILTHRSDKMLKEADMGLINGLFEAVYVNGESIFIALIWRHHKLVQGLSTTYIFLVCLCACSYNI
jgi:hypothetical protein